VTEHIQGESSLIALGGIKKPIGLQGCCALEMFGETLKKVSLPLEVFVGSAERNCTPLTLTAVEFRPKGPVCFFSTINDVESANALRGFFLFIHASALPKLEKDTYYHFELIGLRVQTDSGKELGECINVYNYPSVDSIEVNRSSGVTVIIPLTTDAVADIDWKSGYVTVRHAFIEELL
jgi:16S rRNA processing protein RimM